MDVLNRANEEYRLVHGRYAVPFEAFYNEVVSTDISLQQDFRRWLERRQAGAHSRMTASTFSFCSFPFIFDAAAKSQILQLDANLQ
ncbi:hypothetical protein EON68_00035, partial [archaeon]